MRRRHKEMRWLDERLPDYVKTEVNRNRVEMNVRISTSRLKRVIADAGIE